MKAAKLYAQMEKVFINPALTDDWARFMGSIADFLSENFKQRSMGLVCDNSVEIKRVYTAVFPSNLVMQAILDKGEKDVLLFVHHPSIWDIRKAPSVFHQMDIGLLEKFRENRISIYNLHVPLDNYGDYSTGYTLAKALGLTDLKPFFEYYGSLAAVFGKTDITKVKEMQGKVAMVLGHKASLYQYGTDEIKNGMVAVAAGGGNIIELLKEITNEGVNTLVTGVTIKCTHTLKEHDYAKDKKINVLGGTHYSTEKPACQAMCGYFKKLGLPSEFIDDAPVMEDL
jgi:putative NIF3 family GTP cyclohydrolase 1 type 2